MVKVVQINQYMDKALYKITDKAHSTMTSVDGHSFIWRKCTQEELAFAFEELKLTDYVEKINTKNEKNKNKKSKKSSHNKKE